MLQDEAFGIIPVLGPFGPAIAPPRLPIAPQPRQYLLICHRKGHWGFPKGHRERGESALEAAAREFHEETGLSASRVFPELKFVENYRFKKKKRDLWVEKRVLYFVGQVQPCAQGEAPPVTIQEAEISDFCWCTAPEAEARLSYAVGRRMLRACEAALTALPTEGFWT